MSDPGPSPAAAETRPTGPISETTSKPTPNPAHRADQRHATAEPRSEARGAAPGTTPRATTASPAAPAAPSGAGPSGPPAAPHLRPAQRAGLLLTLILGSLTALPALSMDMYLPALPEVGTSLHSPAATVQLTLTACLLGLAAGQLVVGPMSDRWGRRRPLVIGMTAYVLASAACALAPTVTLLVVFRLLQGIAGAAGIVIARAVVRDLYDGLAMARFFSTLMLISGAAPILAPVLGGQLLRVTDWRGIFLTLALFGLLLTLIVARWLPETLPPGDRHAGGVADALRTMRGLLTDRVFTGYVLVASFGFATLFSYVSASPFVFQEIYGASPQTFSLLFMLNSIALIAAGQFNGRVLVGRVSLDRVLLVGLGVVGLAACALLLLTLGAFGQVGVVPIAVGCFVLMAGQGLVMPNANSQGMMRSQHAAGSASALLGTTPFLVGAVAVPMVGIAGEDTAVPMAVTQLTALLLATVCFLGLCRPWRSRD